MAYTASEIKNLALQEINHETISDWNDSTNTDIAIINAQYGLAKAVALSMYQWSWAFKYAVLPTYSYVFTMPADRKSNTAISLYTDSTMTTQITEFVNDEDKIYTNTDSVYLEYVDTSNAQAFATLTGSKITETISLYKRATLLPTDFIGYLAACTDENMRILGNYINVGNAVYTNSEKLYIKYIADVEESVFTPEFVDWFKIFLAMRINSYLNGDMQRQQLLENNEPFYFRKAKNIDSKRNKHDSLDGNPMLWIRGKMGGGIA